MLCVFPENNTPEMCLFFQPKFNMTSLDPDTVALLSRRAYDVAASSKGVKVFLNGKRIPIKVILTSLT